MAKSEIPWNKTQKGAFQETTPWRVHSFQRVKAYTALLSLETLSLRNLWRDIKWRLEAWGEKKMSSDENWREVLEYLLCDMCIHLIELNHSLDWAVLNIVSVQPDKGNLGPLLRICWKRNTLRYTPEGKFLWNCSRSCEFHSHSEASVFIEQYFNTVSF